MGSGNKAHGKLHRVIRWLFDKAEPFIDHLYINRKQNFSNYLLPFSRINITSSPTIGVPPNSSFKLPVR
jgi:hypothetical protein